MFVCRIEEEYFKSLRGRSCHIQNKKINKEKKRASLKAAQKRILEKKIYEKNIKMYSSKETPLPVPFVEGASTIILINTTATCEINTINNNSD